MSSMTRGLTACVVAALSLALLLMWRQATLPPTAPSVPIAWVGLGEIVRDRSIFLDNGRARLGVCPEVGRIVWFSSSETRDNVLWINDSQPFIERRASQGWCNWGGDKLWPAPQSDWAEVMGWRWPPDPVLDGLSWKLLDHGPLSCVMESRPSPYWGVAFRRRITMDADRPLVEIRNTMVRVSECGSPVNIWSVTQVERPECCLLGIAEPTAEPSRASWRWLSGEPPGVAASPVVREIGGAVEYSPPGEPPTKIGTMGRWIAAVYPDVIFLQETAVIDPDGDYADNASVQVYADARCVEMELLSPDPASP